MSHWISFQWLRWYDTFFDKFLLKNFIMPPEPLETNPTAQMRDKTPPVSVKTGGDPNPWFIAE